MKTSHKSMGADAAGALVINEGLKTQDEVKKLREGYEEASRRIELHISQVCQYITNSGYFTFIQGSIQRANN